VKIGIAAPRDVSIFRKEVLTTIVASNQAAAVRAVALPKLPRVPKAAASAPPSDQSKTLAT
jgi:sRNA-binding carbon storage regulator CsrA